MGAVPPMNEQEWGAVFEQYKQFPQYQQVNQGMSLGEFKQIFFWEYIHRLLGRLIGVVFFFPYLIFLLQGRLRGRLAVKVAIGFFLGGFQGVLGWYMVQSGLIHVPQVSHYRLASHLGLAFLIAAYLYWIFLDLTAGYRSKPQKKNWIYRWALVLLGLLSVQIVWGAFVAGLRAGLIFNTFPKMNGQWIPDGLIAHSPAWISFFQNPTAVQFVHRGLAWILLGGMLVFYLAVRRVQVSLSFRVRLFAMTSLVVVQFMLGMSTLLLKVPVKMATAHQVVGCLLLLSLIAVLHQSRTEGESG